MTHPTETLRGFPQSGDGLIAEVLRADRRRIVFRAEFALSGDLVERFRDRPEHLMFSERSRIARLGVRVQCEAPGAGELSEDRVSLTLTATPVIPGYPALAAFRDFFTTGFPVGRLICCDPEARLSSDEVLAALNRSDLKLPATTTISSDGRILFAPHKVVCDLKGPLDAETLSRILFKSEGRQILNRFQIRRRVPALVIPAGEGVITTCSMYLNDHYVVLQNGDNAPPDLGSHLPAIILDPIKTRGIRIYLEIVNTSRNPIVNPLIGATVYKAPRRNYRRRAGGGGRAEAAVAGPIPFNYSDMRRLDSRFEEMPDATCHFRNRPLAVIGNGDGGPQALETARLLQNGPAEPCPVTKAGCPSGREDFTARSPCPHVYATARLKPAIPDRPAVLALRYFPNMLEHLDIINLAYEGQVSALYFLEPSCEYGPFLSQLDHHRLQEYHAFGVSVYWVSALNKALMVHTMRDGKGYFVLPARLADFHKSMLFAFYGSNQPLSERGVDRLGRLMDALIAFWGRNIGILTGGGSGVMEHVNTFARKRGVLSGANFLDITDQPMTTDVDFCQVFQDSCRHSRQKWFEIASFPIFNVGGIGSLEELGITLCNMKLSIMEPVPVVLFDSEGDGGFWKGAGDQIRHMVQAGRAPAWVGDNLVITHDPAVVIQAYRERLQLF